MAQTTGPNSGIQTLVQAAFTDAPDMVAVAKCESGFRQFSSEGVVLRGGSAGKYIGIFQIGERLHIAPATKLGLDILTIDGNIAYARHLYDQQGIAPWRECSPATKNTAPAPSTSASQPTSLTKALTLGMTDPQVLLLQRLLNSAGFNIATSGPGSIGNETTSFGPRTRDALRRFQCAKSVACTGTESTTGYGRLGPKTRALLTQPTTP